MRDHRLFDLGVPLVLVDASMSGVEIARRAAAFAPSPPPVVVYVGERKQPDVPDLSDMLFPVEPKLAARTGITHKAFKDMNRKERRAFLSGKKR